MKIFGNLRVCTINNAQTELKRPGLSRSFLRGRPGLSAKRFDKTTFPE
jgi:hypothetical protein